MQKFKKILLCLVLILVLVCSACTESNTEVVPPTTTIPTPTPTPTPTEPETETKQEEINLDGIVFNDLEVEYDGKAHSVVAENIPDGVQTEYVNNDKVDAGSYVVTLKITKDKELLKSLDANLVITKKKAVVTIDNQTSPLGEIKELTYSVEGVLDQDDLGVNLTVETPKSGQYEIKGSWTNQNYDVTFNSAIYTVTETLFDSSAFAGSSPFLPNYAPFALYDTTLFSNTVVTKISFQFHSFASGYNKNSSNLYIPIYVVKSDFSTKQNECTYDNGKLIRLELTGKLNEVSSGDWVTCENLHIVVGEDETLAFGDPYMTVLPGFLRNNGTHGFYNRIFDNKGNNNHSLVFDIEGYRTKDKVNTNGGFVEDDINYISFLGDSISTFSGVSNSTSYNPTIGSNAIWYPNNNYTGANLTLNDTWWKQAANELGYEVCVNNSWSGSVINTAQTYNVRSKNLHNNKKHAPDVIVVFMGVNDYAANTPVGSYDGTYAAPLNPTNFSEAYGRTIANMKETYPDAEIFCCTFLSDRKRMSSDVNGAGISINQYLNAIKTIATNLGVNVIDLYNETGINGSTITSYTVDRLHPNAAGMDLITKVVVEKVKAKLESK